MGVQSICRGRKEQFSSRIPYVDGQMLLPSAIRAATQVR